MTPTIIYELGALFGYLGGLITGVMFWRGQAIRWRNRVGYMGRRDWK